MGSVMVKCPQTGQDISTGIGPDRQSFRATPVFFRESTARSVGPSMNGPSGCEAELPPHRRFLQGGRTAKPTHPRRVHPEHEKLETFDGLTNN
jgi:hypothetical protein